MLKTALILAGGKGTRLLPLTNSIPKPMVPINNRPFLEFLITDLVKNGFLNIVIAVGYLHQIIIDYFGDGTNFSCKITYSIGDDNFMTGLRIWNALKLIKSDSFLLCYSDNICPLPLNKMWDEFNKNQKHGQITVYRNADNYSKSNVSINQDCLITKYSKARNTVGLNGVEIGYSIFNKSAFNILNGMNIPYEEKVFQNLISKKLLYSFVTDHRYYGVGTPSRFPSTSQYLKNIKTIFLDRDGVINKKAPQGEYITTPNEFIWLKGSLEAIRILDKQKFQIFVVTNQAGIARNKFTINDLQSINNKMVNEICKIGAKVQKIYFCPHHWDDNCFCRKPQPGMFFQAQKEFCLNLTESWFLGDDDRDHEAAQKANIKFLKITSEFNLLKAVKFILKNQ